MKYRCAFNFILPLALLAFCALAAGAENISVAQYLQQLHNMAQKVDALKTDPGQAGKLVAEIPDTLSVSTGSSEIKINYKPLKADLTTFSHAEEEKRAALLNQIQNYVQSLTSEAEAYDRAGTNLSAAHDKLTAILARNEFSKVRGPNVKDALLARIFRWIARHLRGFGGSNSTFNLMRFFIYLLVGIAATFLLIWTIRRLRRPQEELPQREIIPFSPSARSWRAWLAEARDLAQQQDWRNAIHLAYWAGISYLEEHGAWKPNRARTPREYLRLIGSRAAQYPVLAALTRKLEHVWYGYGEAAESDFHDTLSQLEKLGCR
ncbi:MAG TPA: DUF4129 domain-containing protein [Candidatus Angelobacter sp.]|nr:DUF4129 domain-containing protein [Candidatus Angelobacter sp.]